MSDVLAELFGNIPLSKLLEGLESDIDDLLWALEAPLGETAYQRIIAAQRPARELAQTLRTRKNEAALADAFRDVVFASTKLYALLTPAAKARVNGSSLAEDSHDTGGAHLDAPPSYDEHHTHPRSPSPVPPPPPPRRAQPPPAPPPAPRAAPPPPRVVSPPPVRYQPPPPPVRATTPLPPRNVVEVDVYLPEITTAAQLNVEVGAIQRPGGKALVILFMNPTSQSTAEFLPVFARLVPEFKEAKFMTLSVKSAGMADVMETLSVSLLPTVLTFCSDGFFRTTGKDLPSLRNDITRAINDMRTMAVINQWPRAPINWGQSSALALWRGLPQTVQEIAALGSVDHGVRVHLLHTLPYVEDVDPNGCRFLRDANVMKHFCGHFFIQGEQMFSCYDCGVNGQFADFCEKCWSNASHSGHTAIKRAAPNDSYMCDCGRLSRTGSGDVIGDHCSLHQAQDSTDALATLLALSMLLNAR